MARCLLLGAMAGLLLAGCNKAPDAASGESRFIKIDGSSTVYPVTEAVAEEFQKTNRGVKVTVGVSGTGGGFKKFTRGETDISNASRPISKEEMAEAKKHNIEFIELPVCFDALTVVVNPQNDWVTSMTVEELKKIWEPGAQGKLTHWNQVRSDWPNEKIHLFGPGSDSGTFDYFTEAVVGKAKSSRSDFTASEDDNVLVQGVERNRYALGYFGYAYYEAHAAKLKAVPVQWEKNKVKEPVAPSRESVLAGTYNPLSRPLFIYVSTKASDRPEVREFVEFYLKDGPKLIQEVKYVPLPEKAYETALDRFRKREIGTGFGGVSEIGLPIEELLKRTPKS